MIFWLLILAVDAEIVLFLSPSDFLRLHMLCCYLVYVVCIWFLYFIPSLIVFHIIPPQSKTLCISGFKLPSI